MEISLLEMSGYEHLIEKYTIARTLRDTSCLEDLECALTTFRARVKSQSKREQFDLYGCATDFYYNQTGSTKFEK
ncbi:hypothetical protein CMI38_02800 [Candidatus Pacearchaeota archaeon]|jgi:hypothetical protein|nr:hypothetical protein [Candidatus Pacearchaeota archaeon]|tara:strand:- start:62 stop:286 length:225 start_codon:yes stop_codon:yes gene_type:complete